MFFIPSLLLLITGNAQKIDSTGSIRTEIYSQVTISKSEYEIDDKGEKKMIYDYADSVKRSTFFIDDKNLHTALFSITIKEYKEGKKINEENIFSKEPINEYAKFTSFEDSSFVFSLYRKEIDSNTVCFGFRMPTKLIPIAYNVNNNADYQIVEGDAFWGKVPLNKSFTLFIYTLPDRNSNDPFYRDENRRKVSPGKWSEEYKLKHSFVIDMTIHTGD